MRERSIPLMRFNDPVRAEDVRLMLQEEGIESSLEGGEPSRGSLEEPSLTSAEYIVLYIPVGYMDKAITLIDEFLDAETEDIGEGIA